MKPLLLDEGDKIIKTMESSIEWQEASPWLGVFVEKHSENVLVKIADNGIGLTAEEKRQVFDRFYQASASIPGCGVGLTIVKRIVEDLKGRIWFESAGKNRGTTVLIELPQEIAVYDSNNVKVSMHG